VDIVWKYVLDRINGITPAWDIRVFVKPEMLKRAKIEEGRLRLITAVSMIDQIVDRMLFGELNLLEVQNFHDIPFKCGWSPLVGNGAALLRESLKTDTFMAIDRTCWDWIVPEWA
jgi:hypothetical protein